ncbi:MAG TPA: hypothetical protein VLH10_10985, partial [Yinghuangia sp.]|nr:hypothetical protein [Yinghuangia sp.]
MTGGGVNAATPGDDSQGSTQDAQPPSPVRPYVSRLFVRPDMGSYPREFRAVTIRPRPPVVLVAWGADAAHATLALNRGRCHAED